jgi:hypothetical protein
VRARLARLREPLSLAVMVLIGLALYCQASSTVIAGAHWQTWLLGGLFSWALAAVLPKN